MLRNAASRKFAWVYGGSLAIKIGVLLLFVALAVRLGGGA